MDLLLGKDYQFAFFEGSFVPVGSDDIHFVRKSQPISPNYRLMRINYWDHRKIVPAEDPKIPLYFSRMYRASEDIIRRAISFERKMKICNPWILDDSQISELEMTGNALSYLVEGRRQLFNSMAIWCSYIVWLNYHGKIVPVHEDNSAIFQMAQDVYQNREGYGDLVHMYYTFRRCTLEFRLPQNWHQIIIKRGEVDAFIIPKKVVCLENERFKQFSEFMIESFSLTTESFVVREDNVKNGDLLKSSYEKVECGDKVYYVGEYVNGLKGDVSGIPWSDKKCVVELDSSKPFISKKKFELAVSLVNSQAFVPEATDGCSCVKCSYECSMFSSVVNGPALFKEIGNVEGHNYSLNVVYPNPDIVKRARKEIYIKMASNYLDCTWVTLQYSPGKMMPANFVESVIRPISECFQLFSANDRYYFGFPREVSVSFLYSKFPRSKIRSNGYCFYRTPFLAFPSPHLHLMSALGISRSVLDAAVRSYAHLWSDGSFVFVGPTLKNVSSSLLVALARRVAASSVSPRPLVIPDVNILFKGSSSKDSIRRLFMSLAARKLFVVCGSGYVVRGHMPQERKIAADLGDPSLIESVSDSNATEPV